MSEIKRLNLPVSEIDGNIGQIEGLPANPRQWTIDEIESLARSIEETPELLEARGVIVIKHEDRYVALGGNMRLQAVRGLGWKEIPCIVMPEDTSAEKMQEIVIKDNGSFGEWDWSDLKQDWDTSKLAAWGVASWYTPEVEMVSDVEGLENLPEELLGQDLEADDLEALEGDDEVARKHVVITYDENSRWILENTFGVRDITSKVIWRLEDILAMRAKQQND